MKAQEILLASALIALVGGAGTALATRAFMASNSRASSARTLESVPLAPSTASAETARALEDLRRANTALVQRVETLEARLTKSERTRTAVAVEMEGEPDEALAFEPRASERRLGSQEGSPDTLELTPAFVDSVGQALDKIKDKEAAEREKKRKELQGLRIEERVTRLQQELGLSSRQTSDLRTALIAQDDKREALFSGMRDGLGDPRDMRESFRTIREETHTTLQAVLTAEQFASYQQSEEPEFGRRGFGDFGPPGGRPPEDGFERRGR